MFYSSKPAELRDFLSDKLGLSSYDMGEGWLIFDIPEADMGVHPSGELGEHGAPSGTHDISFYTDDIETTVEELKAKGVEFKGPVEDQGWGKVTQMKVPGGFWLQLYQPNYGK